MKKRRKNFDNLMKKAKLKIKKRLKQKLYPSEMDLAKILILETIQKNNKLLKCNCGSRQSKKNTPVKKKSLLEKRSSPSR